VQSEPSGLTSLLDDTPDAVALDPTETGDADGGALDPRSPTVLVTDGWTREQGAKLAAEWEALSIDASFAQMTDEEAREAAEKQHAGANVGLGPRAGRRRGTAAPGSVAVPVAPPKGGADRAPKSLADVARMSDAENVAADCFGALFEARPQLAKTPADERRAQYMAEVMESDDYQALHRRTAHQVELARIGAGSLALQYASHAVTEGAREEGKGAPDPSSPEGIAAEARRMRSTRRALQAATEAVETAEAAAAGLGGADDAGTLAPAELAKVARMAGANRTLRGILERAGRYRTRARSLQTERLDAPRGFITGVELSGNLAVALASERAAVGGVVPELELLAQYRLATNRLLGYRHKARTPVAAGPIIVSVDESGSMSGEPLMCAKGIALAMAWVARSQRRPCVLSAFAGTPNIRAIAAERGAGQERVAPETIADWCVEQIGGGTVPDGPLVTLRGSDYLNLEAMRGKTDHIIITDAQLHISDEIVADYREWAHRNQVRTYVIVIGANAGDMARVATQCWCVSDLSLSQGAVEAALSVGPE
jgi:uncharacterized protein with von Willebrand factor type A (vWA) domain